ncbi:alkane 1-monooxygenase [Roseovarius sp. SCSIO 43702]|uniref:alkane 1-monooxygenase n=1 Tax=Roseovarius sp. SCSIO 43702 TaxID=2823043 RepID=UPI001C72A673|nr:alkane 1-monooxygenase [Roseovarius sp. SCSIO 43702]QYX57228.1 alkane 1-monooxygenase [Roseovarius sp. SCSIO 43702]
MILFALASITPLALVLGAATWGGALAWLAVGYMTVLVFGMDRLIAREAVNAPEGAEFPAAGVLLWVLGVGHFGVLGAALWAVAGPGTLDGGERFLVALAAGLVFGQISHPAAHELIHRPGRGARLLGRLVYASLLVGHHASAHLRVHHVHVGTARDPNSPPRGRGFYRYALNAGVGSFRAGFREESAMLARAGRAWWRHPYVLYLGVGLGLTVAVALWLGWRGVAVFVGLSAYAQMQILLSDYVQHYGLRRRIRGDGRPEPVDLRHSWNAPHWYSSALMVNAPRHSDHHVTPGRPFPALQLRADMPMLPLPVPVMASIALIPPLWRRVMDPRVVEWETAENRAHRDGDGGQAAADMAG